MLGGFSAPAASTVKFQRPKVHFALRRDSRGLGAGRMNTNDVTKVAEYICHYYYNEAG